MAHGTNITIQNMDEYLDQDELEGIRSLLAYILQDSTDLDSDTICSLVFNEGRKITWH